MVAKTADTIKVSKSLALGKKLWKKYSPGGKLWELWDVALLLQEKDAQPYFIYSSNGFLPLSYEPHEKRYTFFGSTFVENFSFWFPLEEFPLFLEKIPQGTMLYDLNGDTVEKVLMMYPEAKKYFPEQDFRYVLLTTDFHQHLQGFSKKHRKNLLYDLKKMLDLKYQISFSPLDHLEKLFDFNVERFGTESDYHDPVFRERVSNLAKYLHQKKMLVTLNIEIDGMVEGVIFSAVYKNVCYVMNSGYNLAHKNLGKVLVAEMIKKALSLGVKEIDFLVGDTGWKQLWNLEKKTCYTFKKV
ncbi:MAG TPA: GNAT family N-acetyltransferase [Candidatus Nanoarchaeia archaeon]|nr:GNAT family N-acetyltransferase [Candidatus Nanoarchaeia archaeon]